MDCKIHKNKNYRTTSIYHLKDKNLSLKAQGLLSKILLLPDGWNYTIKGLVSICLEKETTIKSTLDELKLNKYLVVTKHKPCEANGGRWSYEYNFYEKPLQDIEIQDIETLGLESPMLYNNILSKDNMLNNTIIDKSIIDINNNKKNTKKSFGKITKQEQLKNDLILVINQFFIDSDILESLETHILSLFEISKLPSTISYKTSLNDLKKFKKEDILEMIKKSIKSNYNTFYPLNNKTGLARDGLPQLVETENDRIETEDKNKRKLAKYGIEV